MFLFHWLASHIFSDEIKKKIQNWQPLPNTRDAAMFRKGWHTHPLSGPLPVSGTFFLRTEVTWPKSFRYYPAELDEQEEEGLQVSSRTVAQSVAYSSWVWTSDMGP